MLPEQSPAMLDDPQHRDCPLPNPAKAALREPWDHAPHLRVVVQAVFASIKTTINRRPPGEVV